MSKHKMHSVLEYDSTWMESKSKMHVQTQTNHKYVCIFGIVTITILNITTYTI